MCIYALNYVKKIQKKKLNFWIEKESIIIFKMIKNYLKIVATACFFDKDQIFFGYLFMINEFTQFQINFITFLTINHS